MTDLDRLSKEELALELTELKKLYDSLNDLYMKEKEDNLLRFESLEKEWMMLRKLVDMLPTHLYIKNTQHRFIMANSACAKYMGAESYEELIGKTDRDFYAREVASEFENDETKVLKGNPLINKEEISVHDNDKKEIILTSKIPLYDKSENIIGLVGTGIDITKSKNAEVALQESESRLVRAEKVAKIGNWKLILESRKMLSSVGARLLYGIEEEVTSLDVIKNIPLPEYREMMNKALDDLIKKDIPYNVEFKIKRPSDNSIADIQSIGEFDKKNNIVLGVIYDITERKKTELEMLRAKEKAEESDRLKTAFLANMSHEIRTPMNGILGFAGLLKEPGLTGETQQEFISIIEKSGARMLNIINDIIDISKIESGLMEKNSAETDINEQIDSIINFFKIEAEQKGIGLFFNKPQNIDISLIETDRIKFNAILTNLAKNAIKFTEEGHVDIGYNIKNDFIEIYVKDTGIGIPINRQKAIFDRFVQADIGDTRAYQGAGLGLSISKAYVEMLGGQIWLESQEGIGTTFYFTHPYKQKPAEISILEQLSSLNLTGKQPRNLKILIVEDDQASEILITRAIKDLSREVIKVSNGIDAVKTCMNNLDIDIVLMDIKMSGIDGYEATRQIRLFNNKVKIIAQTAFALMGDKEKALSSGCNDYLTKPTRKDLLIATICKQFENE